MRICLFDIDGTLINTGNAGKKAIETVLADDFNVSHPIDNIETAGRTDLAIILDILAYYKIEATPETIERFQKLYLVQLQIQLNICKGNVLPGVIKVLDELVSQPDVYLGLLTGNLAGGALLKVSHYKLHEYFTFGSYGDRHVDRNDVARHALGEIHKRHGESFRPECIWIVGDTPADVQCARAINANSIAVETGIYDREQLEATHPTLLLEDLTDISLLDVLFSAK